jgi:hypothetical protein
MEPLSTPGARYPPPRRGGGDGRWYCWPIAAMCIPMLAGAVVLVLTHRAGVTFLFLFLSCMMLMVLLMAWLGHSPHERVSHRRLPAWWRFPHASGLPAMPASAASSMPLQRNVLPAHPAAQAFRER